MLRDASSGSGVPHIIGYEVAEPFIRTAHDDEDWSIPITAGRGPCQICRWANPANLCPGFRGSGNDCIRPSCGHSFAAHD